VERAPAANETDVLDSAEQVGGQRRIVTEVAQQGAGQGKWLVADLGRRARPATGARESVEQDRPGPTPAGVAADS
jgi:hypothetical protein